MHKKTLLSLVACGGIILLFLAWLGVQGRNGVGSVASVHDTELASSSIQRSATMEARVPVIAESDKSSLEVPSATRIVSSVGLPLASVEAIGTADDWIRVSLEDGILEGQGWTRVRAAGHGEASVADAQLVVLMPIASISVPLFVPGDMLGRVQVEDYGLDLSHYLVSGFVEGAWIMAFDAGVLQSLLPKLQVSFSLASNKTLTITHRLQDISQVIVALPEKVERVATRDLRVELQPVIEGARITLWSDPGDASVIHQQHEWGAVVLQDSTHMSNHVVSAAGFVIVGDLPLGVEYGISVVSDSGEYAKQYFLHEHGVQIVRLHPGIRIGGQLAGLCLPPTVDIAWSFIDDSSSSWHGTLTSPISSALFSAAIPGNVPFAIGALDRLPSSLEVLIKTKGNADLKLQLAVAEGDRLDLGKLVLVPTEPDVIINIDLDSSALAYQSLLMNNGGQTDSIVIEEAWTCNGSIRLRLQNGNGLVKIYGPNGLTSQRGLRLEDEIVLTVNGSEGHGLVRLDGNRFNPVDSRLFAIELKPSSSTVGMNKKICFGWMWKGIRHQVASFDTESLLEAVKAEVLAPTLGADLWWGLDGESSSIRTAPMESGLRVDLAF